MAIYVFNLMVGYFPCGVDNAQGYRAQILNRTGIPVKYIFTEMPSAQDIEYYREIGIPVGEMLSAHSYFTDIFSLEATEKVDVKLLELKESLQYTDVRYTNEGIELLKNGEYVAIILYDTERKGYLRYIKYYNDARLVRSEFYTNGLLYADYYVIAATDGCNYMKLVRRTYFNGDGIVAYDMIYENGEERYLFPDGRCCTKPEFIAEFIKKLNLSEKDIVIIDRFSQWEFVQPLFQFGNKARLIAVLHSGHYYEENEGPAHLVYLNEEYFYPFKYSQFIDAVVVSTEEQKRELREKLMEYGQQISRIAVIPAGGLRCLRYPETQRRPYSLIAVSRLARSKRVHEIIKSVILAHKENPQISLDIYGSGEYEQELRMLVEENNAQQYICFAGYQDMTEVYRNYEVFLTASFHESLGLSMMEAVGSGMALIGLDVKYGSRLFIHPGKNGYLINVDLKHMKDSTQRIRNMAVKIMEIFENKERLKKFHEYSYRLGEEFLFHKTEEKWMRLLME